MSDFPTNVKLLMEQLTRLYQQIALLLETADTIFAEKAWTPVTNSVITGSNSISLPQQWLARTVHRFYNNAGAEPQLGNVLPFVSILLFDPEHAQRTSTPLLSAGWLRYPPGVKADESYEYWYSRHYIWMENAIANGMLFTAQGTAWPKWKLPWQIISVLALPLEELTDTDELRKRIHPVLEALSGES